MSWKISGYQKIKRTQVKIICTVPFFFIQGNAKEYLDSTLAASILLPKL